MYVSWDVCIMIVCVKQEQCQFFLYLVYLRFWTNLSLTEMSIMFSCCPSVHLFITKVCMCNSSCILKGISLKLCMLVYYTMEICILFRQFDWTIFEGVIAPFYLKYFINKFLCSKLCMLACYSVEIFIPLQWLFASLKLDLPLPLHIRKGEAIKDQILIRLN